MELKGLVKLLPLFPAGSGNFSRYLDRYLGGNRASLLKTGSETYRAMWAAIEGAQTSVHLETYIYRFDAVGREFARRLEAKARAGVRVRVIFDSAGSFDIDLALVHRLRNAGVQFLEYHPLAPWEPRWAWTRRDHRKLLVVDSALGFTGGVNVCAEHAPPEEGGGGWLDYHAQVVGPAAYEMDRLFRSVWFKETGRWFPLPPPPAAPHAPALAWVASNQEFLHRRRIRSAYLAAVKAARREVLVANAYFVPDVRTVFTLAAAARRGVKVSVLVQGKYDVAAARYAGRFQFDYLLRQGVRLWEWSGPLLHAKAAVVDDTWATVGSYNLDHRSLHHDLEVNLCLIDPSFARELAASLRRNMAEARELTLEPWRKRPGSEKLAEAFFYLFRYFI